MTEDLIIQVQNLRVQFPHSDNPIFSGISFDVPRGCLFGIFGETGCGKSTLAQCLVGFVPPHLIQGRISLNFRGFTAEADKTEEILWRKKLRGRRVVYVPQDPYKALNPYEKIGRQLQRVLGAYGNRFTVGGLLDKVGLSLDFAHSFPRMMSAGQRQRVIIAHALAIEPELLILDEPTASVDAEGRDMLRRCFLDLVANGKSLVVISHEVDEYLPIVSRSNRLYFSRVTSTSIHVQQRVHRVSAPSPDSPQLFNLSGVRKNFNGLPVLTNVNLEVRRNQWVYLEGSNGTGKTTLLRIILGTLLPDCGKAEWQGKLLPWHKFYAHTKSQIHSVFQDTFHSLNPRISIQSSVREVVSCARRRDRAEIARRAEYLWRHLNLSPNLYQMIPYQLSYGQQKRVALVRTLLKYEVEKRRKPEALHLFLFDEVFAGIHWMLRDKAIFLLQEMRKEGQFSVIWVAHGHEVLKNLCERIYRLENGALVC